MVRIVSLTTVLPTNVEVGKPIVSDTRSIFDKLILSIKWSRSVNTPSDLAGAGSETTQFPIMPRCASSRAAVLEASTQAEPMRRLQSGACKMAPVARPLAAMSAQARPLVPLDAEASMCVSQLVSGVSSGT
jgi:hypothetical protein